MPTTQSPTNAPVLESWCTVSRTQEIVFHSRVHSIFSVDQITLVKRSITFKCITPKRTHVLSFRGQCLDLITSCVLHFGRHLLFYLDEKLVSYLTLRRRLDKKEKALRP